MGGTIAKGALNWHFRRNISKKRHFLGKKPIRKKPIRIKRR